VFPHQGVSQIILHILGVFLFLVGYGILEVSCSVKQFVFCQSLLFCSYCLLEGGASCFAS